MRGAGLGETMRCCVLLVALALLWSVRATPARAEIPAEWHGSKVVGVRIVGPAEGTLDPALVGVPIGATLDRALLRGAIRRLLEDGHWADVQIDGAYEGEGVVLSFQLVPRLVVRRVDAIGNRVLDDLTVLRLVGLREESELDVSRFPALVSTLSEAYEKRGYYDARIQFVLRDTDEPGIKVVRVEIAEGAPTTLHKVRFRGEQLPRWRGVRRLVGVGLGQPADLSRIERGLDGTERLLRRSGYYAAELGTPELTRKGHRATVIVPSSIGHRFEVRFHGTGQISRSELFAELSLDQERFTGDASLRTIEQKLTEHYRRYGFVDVRVKASVHPEQRQLPGGDPSRVIYETIEIIDVHIDTGAQLEIESITFPGATHYSADFLREQVYSYLEEELPGSAMRAPVDSDVADRLGFGGGATRTERSAPKPLLLDPRRLFYAPAYGRAVEHIRELYRADGYLDVQVSDVRLEPLREPHHALSVITIYEGPRTFLHAVNVEGNRTLSSRKLLEAAGLTRDQPFSYLNLEQARLRMVALCQEEGFFFATVQPTVRRSEEGSRAVVTFAVNENYPVQVGAIEVRGAERSSTWMIRDRVRLRTGELYRPSRARETQEALLALDVFSSVVVGPDEPNLPARVKTVVVTVTERKNQWLGWNAGFSTGEGARGGLEYGYRNLFGSAVHLSFRGQLGYQIVFLDDEIEERYETLEPNERAEYQATLSLGVPYVPHLPKIRLGLDVSALADIQRDFRMQKESAVASLFYRPLRRFALTLAEELEFSDFYLFEQHDLDNIGNLTPADLVPEGRNTLLSTQITGAWDRRDRSFNAHRGFLLSITSEWARTLRGDRPEIAGIEGDEFKSNMLRFTGSFAFYVPLGPKVTFASQTRYGRVVHLVHDSQAYPNRRFYLGGPNFRGFFQNEMVPQDLEDRDSDDTGIISRGADTFIASQNELRFPLFGELYGGIFTDIGNLWADPSAFDLRQLEPVVGLGLRLQTPVASLAFDYGVRAIRTQPFGIVGAFQFAFQTF